MSARRIADDRFSSEAFAARERAFLWPHTVRVSLGDEPAETARHGLGWAGADVAERLGPLDPLIAGLRLGARAILRHVWCEPECNWKVGVDAHNEAAHVGRLHPELAGRVHQERAEVEPLGDHGRIRVPTTNGLTDHLFVFPNLQLGSSGDGREIQLLRHLPGPTPGRCRFDLVVFGSVGTRGAAATRRVECDDDAFGPITGADLRVLGALQRGLTAARFPGISPGPAEVLVSRFHARLDAMLTRG